MSQQFFIGFEVHQPYRLKKEFIPTNPENSADNQERYFDSANKEILLTICSRCYEPVTSIILDNLDDGFSCAFSLSGILVEQLERWAPDVLDLFVQVADHSNVELLGESYYHSLAGLFRTMDEFVKQVILHHDLMKDLFRVEPEIFVNPGLILDNRIAKTVRDLGFRAAITEGAGQILQWRSPHYLYQCAGLPIIMRDAGLSDDISLRFPCQDWSEWPLTASRYADWVSGSPGDFIPVFIDYETFGEHLAPDTGIFEFLRYLGPELRKKDVHMVKPSDLLSSPVREEFSIQYPVSWADEEKDVSAWIDCRRQKNAFAAVQEAELFCTDYHTWRTLQTSDHFSAMSCKHGSCMKGHSDISLQPQYQAYVTYMNIVADFEEQSLKKMEKKKLIYPFRSLPVEDAFYFSSPVGLTGHVAFSLVQFAEMIPIVPSESIDFHLLNGDFSRWCIDKLRVPDLSASINQAHSRHDLIDILHKQIPELKNGIG